MTSESHPTMEPKPAPELDKEPEPNKASAPSPEILKHEQKIEKLVTQGPSLDPGENMKRKKEIEEEFKKLETLEKKQSSPRPAPEPSNQDKIRQLFGYSPGFSFSTSYSANKPSSSSSTSSFQGQKENSWMLTGENKNTGDFTAMRITGGMLNEGGRVEYRKFTPAEALKEKGFLPESRRTGVEAKAAEMAAAASKTGETGNKAAEGAGNAASKATDSAFKIAKGAGSAIHAVSKVAEAADKISLRPK